MKEAKKLAELAPKIMNAFHDLGRQHGSGDRLSIRQYQALIILKANNTLTITQLCKKLKLAPSTGTELVNRLIALKYVRKSPMDSDQRQVTLSLTTRGVDLLYQREEALTEMFARFLAPFPPRKATEFVNAFEDIWNSILSYHINKK